MSALLPTVIGVVLAAGLAGVGWLVRKGVASLEDGMVKLGAALGDLADRMISLDRRLTRVEAKQDMHEAIEHGRHRGS